MAEKQTFTAAVKKITDNCKRKIAIPFDLQAILFHLTVVVFLASCSAESKTDATKQPSNSTTNVPVGKLSETPNIRNIKLGETVKMKPGDMISVQETNLKIFMVITGTAAPVLNPETGEKGKAVPWCRVEANVNGKTDGTQLFPDAPRNEFVFEGFKIVGKDITAEGTGNCTLTITKVKN